ncbi:MAG: hypothetical protein Q8L57_03155 [bacterium]|nr:hypothetical protein [bacterium]
MTHKTRRIIFWCLLFFFAIFGPMAVFYSQGYRFDFQEREIIKIGGLSLKIKTGGAKIFINNRFKEESGGLLYTGSFFKLLPKNYEVRVSKENYHDWRKTLIVRPNFITDVFEIILFPQNQTPQKLTDVDFFSFSPARNRLMTASIFGADATSTPYLQIRILEPNGKLIEDFTPLYLKRANFPLKILEARWFNSNEDFILKIQTNKTARWLFGVSGNKIFIDEEIKKALETERKTTALAPIKINADDLFPHPLNQKELFFQAGGAIYTYNPETKSAKETNLGGIETGIFDSFLVRGTNLWWLDKTGALKKKDLNVNLIKETAKIPYFLPDIDYEFISWDNTFGVKTAELIYIYNEKKGDFIELIRPISSAKFSPDRRKLFYLKNNNITVRYLEEVKIGDIKKEGEEDTVLSEKIKEIIWYPNSSHLILATENAIKIAELDSRPLRNIAELAKAAPQITFYNPDNEKIYFLDGDGFLKTVSLK